MKSKNIELLAHNARLRREIESVKEKIPNFVRYTGPIPKNFDEFNDLPEPWQAQVVAENEGFLDDLEAREQIANELAAADRQAARLAEIAEGLPFRSVEEFNELPVWEQEEWAGRMTPEQISAFVTGPPPETEGYL